MADNCELFFGLTPVWLTTVSYSLSIGDQHMSNQRYAPEFKEEAVRQVTERGHSVADVAERLGVSSHSLYNLVKAVKPGKNEQQAKELNEAKKEILALRSQLRRTEEERDILKKAARYFAGNPE